MSAVTPAIASRTVRLVEPIDSLDCIVCGRRVPAGRPVLGAVQPARPYALHRCKACGVIQQHPRWPGVRIRTMRSSSSATVRHDTDESWAHEVQRFAQLGSLLAHPQGRRLLDFGCGAGRLAALARSRGWRVTGLDHDPAAVSRAAVEFGLEVRAGDLSSHVDTLHPFEVVLLRGTLEMASNPLRLLSDVRKVLAPGGTLCIDTLNADAVLRRWGWSRGLALSTCPVNLFNAAALSSVVGGLGFREIEIQAYTLFTQDSRLVRPFLRTLMSWLPDFLVDRVARVFLRRGLNASWSSLKDDPPRSLDTAQRVLDGFLAKPPPRLSSRGDRLLLLARR